MVEYAIRNLGTLRWSHKRSIRDTHSFLLRKNRFMLVVPAQLSESGLHENTASRTQLKSPDPSTIGWQKYSRRSQLLEGSQRLDGRRIPKGGICDLKWFEHQHKSHRLSTSSGRLQKQFTLYALTSSLDFFLDVEAPFPNRGPLQPSNTAYAVS
jgi:hypothetical protein